MTVFERERLALDPGGLEVNRAGKLSQGQRSILRARATGVLIGFIGTSVFAGIAWGVAITGPRVWFAAAFIATVAAPVAFWAFGRIRADLHSGRVVEVTGQPVVTAEDDDDGLLWIKLRGRRIRVPFAAAGIVRQPGDVTAYYTPWSKMLVNLAPSIPPTDPPISP